LVRLEVLRRVVLVPRRRDVVLDFARVEVRALDARVPVARRFALFCA